MSYQVFISYARADTARAQAIERMLREKGVRTFFAPEVIRPGRPFPDDIRAGLDESSEFCLVLSENTLGSHWVLLECGAAFFKRLPSTVVNWTGSQQPVPDVFRYLHYVDPVEIDKYIEEVAARAAGERAWIFGDVPTIRARVIAHCDEVKFARGLRYVPGHDEGEPAGAAAPGYELHHFLSLFVPDLERGRVQLTILPGAGCGLEGADIQANAVFLCDSPRNNPLVAEVLAHYGEWVSGGKIRFTQLDTQGDTSALLVEGKGIYAPDKFDRHMQKYLLGPWNDYLLVMKLPGGVLGLSGVDATVWVLFGITSNGTIAAVRLFAPGLRSAFRQELVTRSNGSMPEFFEAVYRVPLTTASDKYSLDDLENVHFSVLRSRKAEATSDEFDWGELPRFMSTVPASKYGYIETLEDFVVYLNAPERKDGPPDTNAITSAVQLLTEARATEPLASLPSEERRLRSSFPRFPPLTFSTARLPNSSCNVVNRRMKRA